MVFTSCTDNADNAVAEPEQPLSDKEMMMTLYGENKKITDGNYDKSLAVKCINGTFVGKRSGGIVAYKGIPFVGQQPVGELRWKAPVDYVADESVYEAYYNAKSPYQREEPSEKASLYVQGEDCLERLTRGMRATISYRKIQKSFLFPSSTGLVFSASSTCRTCPTEPTTPMLRTWD